ncbi:MAG: tetratricopeptide repeat protein [Alphaproteobacteria bacterium]|jgi:hypothetical protein
MVENDVLIREVNDAVRADRLQMLWQRYRWPLLAAAATLVAVTAGNSLWRHYQTQQQQSITLALAQAQGDYTRADYALAAKGFEALSHETRGTLADIVKLWHARALLAQGKLKAGRRVLQNIVIAPEGHDLYWRDMACLHLIGLQKEGRIPPACMGQTASPLAPVFVQMHAARLWQEGQKREAKALLETMAADAATPPALRQQAGAMLATLRSKRE